MYFFSGGKIKPNTSKQYSNIKSNYEITFDIRSEIRECFDTADIQQQSYAFVPIASLTTKEPQEVVDVLAIVKHVSDIQDIVSQKQGGKVLQKRELTLQDDSGAEIRLTLWGEKAVAITFFGN